MSTPCAEGTTHNDPNAATARTNDINLCRQHDWTCPTIGTKFTRRCCDAPTLPQISTHMVGGPVPPPPLSPTTQLFLKNVINSDEQAIRGARSIGSVETALSRRGRSNSNSSYGSVITSNSFQAISLRHLAALSSSLSAVARKGGERRSTGSSKINAAERRISKDGKLGSW